MSTLKNPFGMRDGRVIVIDDLDESERGLNCNCSCPMCGESFEARMGKERIHHFSHTKKSSCDAEEGVLTGLYLLLAEQLAHSTIEIPAAYIHADYKQFRDTTIHGIDTITENDFDRIFPRNTIYTFPRNLPNPEETMIVYRASTKAWDGVNGKTAFGEPYYECLIDPCFFANNKWEIRQDLEQSIGAIKAISNFNRSMILRIRLYRWCRFEKKYRDDSVQLPEGIPTLYIDIDEEILNPSPETSKIDTDTMLEHLLNPANMQWDSKSLPTVQVEKGKQALMKTFLLRRAREIIYQLQTENSNLLTQTTTLCNELEQANCAKNKYEKDNKWLKAQLETFTEQKRILDEKIAFLQQQLLRKNKDFDSAKDAEIEAKNKEMAEREKQLQTENSNFRTKITTLCDELEQANYAKNRYAKDNKYLKEQLETVTEQKRILDDKIAFLQQQLLRKNKDSDSTKDAVTEVKDKEMAESEGQLATKSHINNPLVSDSKSPYEKQLDERIADLNKRYPHPTSFNLPPKFLYDFCRGRYTIFFCKQCHKWTYEPSPGAAAPTGIPLRNLCKNCL